MVTKSIFMSSTTRLISPYNVQVGNDSEGTEGLAAALIQSAEPPRFHQTNLKTQIRLKGPEIGCHLVRIINKTLANIVKAPIANHDIKSSLIIDFEEPLKRVKVRTDSGK
jgi:hypothetical protein